MDVHLVEEVGIDPQLLRSAAHVAERGLGALLHHRAQLPCQDEALAARHLGGLEEEDVAAGHGPGHADGHAGHLHSLDDLLAQVLALAQVLGQVLRVHHRGAGELPCGDLGGDLAADLADLPFQVAHAGLPGVASDDLPQGVFGEGHLLRVQPVLLDLPRHQVALGDLDLLVLGVAAEQDHLHPVQQGLGDGVQHVGCGDEHHLAQVEGHVQVVVPELPVLLRVQHLQEGAGGIAPEVSAQFVHLVQHEDRVLGAHPAQALDDAAGHGADVGAAEAPDLRLVPDAAQGHAHELATHGSGDADAQAGLAHSGRPHEAEDHAFPLPADLVPQILLFLRRFTLALGPQLAHGQVLQDALLDLLQAVVVLVQDPAGVFDVQVVRCGHLPGQAHHQVQVGLDDAVLRGLDGHASHAVQLPESLLFGLLGHAGRLDALLQLADLRGLLVLLAQLLLDGLELLSQIELPLHPLHLALGLGLDLAAQLHDLHLLVQELDQEQELVLDAVQLQDLLGVLDAQADAAGHQVGQLAGVLHVGGHHRQLVRHAAVQLHQPLEEVLDRSGQGLGLQVLFHLLRQDLHSGPQVGLLLHPFPDADALQPLDRQADGAVRRSEHPVDLGHGPHLVDLIRGGLLQGFVLAGDQSDEAAFGQGVLHQADAALLADGEGQPHHGVDHHAPQREHGQVVVPELHQLFPLGHLRGPSVSLPFCSGVVEHFTLLVLRPLQFVAIPVLFVSFWHGWCLSLLAISVGVSRFVCPARVIDSLMVRWLDPYQLAPALPTLWRSVLGQIIGSRHVVPCHVR